MLDLPLVKLDLQEKWERVNEKKDRILSQNLNPFPFDRLEKARTLLKLIEEALHAINEDNLFRAGYLVRAMEEEGLKFKVPLC